MRQQESGQVTFPRRASGRAGGLIVRQQPKAAPVLGASHAPALRSCSGIDDVIEPGIMEHQADECVRVSADVEAFPQGEICLFNATIRRRMAEVRACSTCDCAVCRPQPLPLLPLLPLLPVCVCVGGGFVVASLW